MIATANLSIPALEQLCREFRVKELYLFGFAASNDLTESSDLDFIVQFDR